MSQSDGSGRDQEPQSAIRGKSLVRVSVLFAICLEVMPVEADVLGVLLSTGNVLLLLAVKVTSLTLILLPLAIYVLLNGVAALRCVKGRVTIVAVIVTINLAWNLFVIFSPRAGGGLHW